ncbi:MAG: branched-chain amino acid aminotransferase [Geminicoccaceae bacterium]|nr:branched-chain amino acid aminotransferase [Geminicoccaceae bacterium]
MSSWVYCDGEWHDGGLPILSAMDHAFWMSSSVFDGARAFDSMAPDLDLHCERVINSAKSLLLQPDRSAEEIRELVLEGVRRFSPDRAVYIRPMFFATTGFVIPDAESTRFVLVIHDLPMPDETGLSVCFSSYRRPARDAAPTDAKAGCLYPNMQRALAEATGRGFRNCITFDPSGNVAELATANLWIARDGVAMTPVSNGTFLSGITRRRVLDLFERSGQPVVETTLTRRDIEEADEVFTTGNYAKVAPITRVENRDLQAGPVYRCARELYWDFSRSAPIHS